jgi:V8-like Glu-specific endopeptidase
VLRRFAVSCFLALAIAVPGTALGGTDGDQVLERSRPPSTHARNWTVPRNSLNANRWTPRRLKSLPALRYQPSLEKSDRFRPQQGDANELLPVVFPPDKPHSFHSTATVAAGPEFQSHIPFARSEIVETTAYPFVTHGKLIIEYANATGFCSGTTVTSDNSSVVMTAAHCLMDPETGEMPSGVYFAPGYRMGNAPYGFWPALAAGVTQQWADSVAADNPDPRYDIGVVVVTPAENGQTIGQAFGTRGIAFNQGTAQLFDSFGYPAAPPFDGERLWMCDSDTSEPLVLFPAPEPLGMGCDMTPGSSGGGWVINNDSVNSVVSFSLPDHPAVQYGPQFGGVAQGLYTQASNYDLTPEPIYHPMSVNLRLSGHLKVRGELTATDGYTNCEPNSLIKVQRKARGGWRKVKNAYTNSSGSYRVRMPDRPGTYRVKAPAGFYEDAPNDICRAATSRTRRHRH